MCIFTFQSVFPTISRVNPPDSEQAYALATVAHSLGITRVGIIYSASSFGKSMEQHFNTTCRSLNITVAGTVSVPPDLRTMSTLKQNQATAEAKDELTAVFVNADIRVYLLALEPNDATIVMPTMVSLGLLGPGNIPLLPTALVLLATLSSGLAVQGDVSRYHLHGSIGLFSVTDPVEEGKLWAAWPKNSTDWAALLATSPQTANMSTIPPPIPVRQAITPWAHSAYDGTMFAAKAIAAAWESCQTGTAGKLDLQCVLQFAQNTTLAGITGNITLNSARDRVGYFGVSNIVNRTHQLRGMTIGNRAPQVSAASIVWSDGAAGRSRAPLWGQEAPPETPAPTVALAVTNTRQDKTAIIISGVLAGVLIVLAIGATIHRIYEHRRRRLPADFRKV